MAGSENFNNIPVPFKTWLKEYAPAGLNFPKAFVAHYAEVPSKEFLEMRNALHGGRTAEKLLSQTTNNDYSTFRAAHEAIESELLVKRPHVPTCDCNWCTHEWL